MIRPVILIGIGVSCVLSSCKSRDGNDLLGTWNSASMDGAQPLKGAFFNARRTQRVDFGGDTGMITDLDPETGREREAPRKRIIVEWTSSTTARIFGVKSFASGEKDPTRCAKEIAFDESRTSFVSPENGRACGELFSDKFYSVSPDQD